MKNKTRNIHINDEEWVYVIDRNPRWDEPTPIRIYEPNKKMHRTTSFDVTGDRAAGQIKPSEIKDYILKNLL